MKPHPRIRKTIKWTGAAATALLVVMWIGSGWVLVQWNYGDGGAVAINAGRAELFAIDPSSEACRPRGWLLETHSFVLSSGESDGMPGFAGYRWVSVGMFVALSLPLTVTAWICDTLARRRAKQNRCPTCNYDRTGLPIGTACPECGYGSAA